MRIEQLRQQHGPTARITWLVYKPGYVRRALRQDRSDLIANIASVRDKYGVNLVFFSDTTQLINYLNNGLPRSQVKIASFEFFGHSNKACFMFDYSNEIDSASKVWLHETELNKIHRGLFTQDALVKSWGCHTGESMSKFWRQADRQTDDRRHWQNRLFQVPDQWLDPPAQRRRTLGRIKTFLFAVETLRGVAGPIKGWELSGLCFPTASTGG